ncbi:MAG: response regulator [Balneolaceae bacterium]|nr:response regulator [Balneolaceae bacterium]
MDQKFSLTGMGSVKKDRQFFVDPLEEIEQPGIKIMNRVSFFLLLVCVVFLIPFHFNESVSLTWFFLSEALAFGLIPILARQGYVNTAKMLHIIYIDVGIIVLSSVFGSEALIQAFFIPTMGLSILLFDTKNIKLRNLSIFISILSYIVLDYVIFDQVAISEDGYNIIRWSVLTAAFVTTWLIFNTFAEFKESAESKTSELLQKEIELNKQLGINQRKLEKYIAELEEARKQLEHNTKAKSAFLATMSHEIRTPMNAIMGMTHMLQKDKPREDQLEPLNILDFSGKTLMTLIDDVLDFSKIEAGRIEFERTEFDLEQLIGAIIESFKAAAANKGIDLQSDIDEEIHNVLIGDPARLTQIINNLVSNAIKFTEEGSVHLSVNKRIETNENIVVAFIVADTGIGIPADRVDTIFDSFTQASGSTKRLYGGTGLGLTISKELTELQGGELHLETEEGKGTKFTVTLTFEKGKVDAFDSTQSKQVVDSNIDTIRGSYVLLAEDNIVNQKVMQRFLERWDIKLKIVDNGEDAVEAVKNEQFDLILMDLQMPVMDGYEATSNIREIEDPAKSTIPIIALTAAALKEVKEQVYDCGMDDFVTKPFDPEDLQRAMVALIKR